MPELLFGKHCCKKRTKAIQTGPMYFSPSQGIATVRISTPRPQPPLSKKTDNCVKKYYDSAPKVHRFRERRTGRARWVVPAGEARAIRVNA
jgi:hypothetical protein